MADHSKPTLSSTYPNFLAEVKGRLADTSRQFDPANGESSNLVMGTIRWTSASRKWEKWSGTAWGDLASEYAISISGSAVKLKTARSIALSGGATAAAVNFDGSANITLNVTGLNPAQLSAAVPVSKGGTGASDAVQARVNLGLGTAATTSASDYAVKNHAHSWGEITGKPTTFPPAAHSHDWGSITGKPTTFAPSAHTHAWGQITGAPATATRWPTWGEVSGKPAQQKDLGFGDIGQVALVRHLYPDTPDGSFVVGTTIAGSRLRVARLLSNEGSTYQNSTFELSAAVKDDTALAGTWRALSAASRARTSYTMCLAIRIS